MKHSANGLFSIITILVKTKKKKTTHVERVPEGTLFIVSSYRRRPPKVRGASLR